MAQDEKKCFIITPIGEENTEIRRHIDGIIDQAIAPALAGKYAIEVSHRKYEIGSINEKIIRSIYEAELVIANLTTLNPNVMFELAIRYSFGKPVIVIAEKGTKLPFDIIDENTIFYVNDPTGAAKLADDIRVFENKIDLSRGDYGPVYKAVEKISLYEAVESGKNLSNEELLNYMVKRLDVIEHSIKTQNKYEESWRESTTKTITLQVSEKAWDDENIATEFENMIFSIPVVKGYKRQGNTLSLALRHPVDDDHERVIVTRVFEFFDMYLSKKA